MFDFDGKRITCLYINHHWNCSNKSCVGISNKHANFRAYIRSSGIQLSTLLEASVLTKVIPIKCIGLQAILELSRSSWSTSRRWNIQTPKPPRRRSVSRSCPRKISSMQFLWFWFYAVSFFGFSLIHFHCNRLLFNIGDGAFGLVLMSILW